MSSVYVQNIWYPIKVEDMCHKPSQVLHPTQQMTPWEREMSEPLIIHYVAVIFKIFHEKLLDR
jgi:hypothetical protein